MSELRVASLLKAGVTRSYTALGERLGSKMKRSPPILEVRHIRSFVNAVSASFQSAGELNSASTVDGRPSAPDADRELEDIRVIRRSYSMPSGGRSASLLPKQALEFCVDAVGHSLDATHLLYSGIDGRRFLNGHQVNGIERLEQREAAVTSLRIGVQHRAQRFDGARRQGAGLVVRRLRHTLKGRYQRRFAILPEATGDSAHRHRLPRRLATQDFRKSPWSAHRQTLRSYRQHRRKRHKRPLTHRRHLDK